jgi:hypothetical protein
MKEFIFKLVSLRFLSVEAFVLPEEKGLFITKKLAGLQFKKRLRISFNERGIKACLTKKFKETMEGGAVFTL